MDYLDFYAKRLNKKGTSAIQADINKSRELTSMEFQSSPSYYKVDIDGILVDTIINRTTDYNVKKVNFKYGELADEGSIITFKDDKYLLMETDYDEIYSFGKMEKCNGIFPIKSVTRTVVGRKPSGEPIIKETIVQKDEPCVAKTTYFSTNENAQMPLPVGRIVLYMKNQESDNLVINAEFEMYGDIYSISSIQKTRVKNDIGVIEITAERRQDK